MDFKKDKIGEIILLIIFWNRRIKFQNRIDLNRKNLALKMTNLVLYRFESNKFGLHCNLMLLINFVVKWTQI